MRRAKLWVDGHPSRSIDCRDRGLQYGDGVFETMRVCDGRIRLLDLHLQRLHGGLKRLGIKSYAAIGTELRRIASREGEGVLKLIVTRGVGARGYRPDTALTPRRIVSFEPLPAMPLQADQEAVRIRVCRTLLGRNPALAGLKTLNRLESVLARSEWTQPGIWEGLLQDEDGNFVSGTMSNLFLRRGPVLITPSLQHCGVAGVMRRWILRTAPALKLRVVQRLVTWKDLESAEEVFMSNAVVGVKSVRSCEWRARRCSLHFKDGATATQLRAKLQRL
jgi:4-amino-4-deoxychorismate lyase